MSIVPRSWPSWNTLPAGCIMHHAGKDGRVIVQEALPAHNKDFVTHKARVQPFQVCQCLQCWAPRWRVAKRKEPFPPGGLLCWLYLHSDWMCHYTWRQCICHPCSRLFCWGQSPHSLIQAGGRQISWAVLSKMASRAHPKLGLHLWVRIFLSGHSPERAWQWHASRAWLFYTGANLMMALLRDFRVIWFLTSKVLAHKFQLLSGIILPPTVA